MESSSSIELLPAEVLTLCFENLPCRSLLSVLATNRRLRSIVVELLKTRFNNAWSVLKRLKFEFKIVISKPSDLDVTHASLLTFNGTFPVTSSNHHLAPLPIATLSLEDHISVSVKEGNTRIVYIDCGINRPANFSRSQVGRSHDSPSLSSYTLIIIINLSLLLRSFNPFLINCSEQSYHQFLMTAEKRDLNIYENLCDLEKGKLVVEPEGMIAFSEKADISRRESSYTVKGVELFLPKFLTIVDY
ncbi:expressed protein [Phakopsora pachyrhizi]|uniref:Expressed protein n=1 Tax=Phakopsora pachyrhizi TaxID=170000 RepID=A0AAV0AUM4_PHAPC|nr:expressed protein [Phakopsora pachyrhizi]